jgi:hypothetical protein
MRKAIGLNNSNCENRVPGFRILNRCSDSHTELCTVDATIIYDSASASTLLIQLVTADSETPLELLVPNLSVIADKKGGGGFTCPLKRGFERMNVL